MKFSKHVTYYQHKFNVIYLIILNKHFDYQRKYLIKKQQLRRRQQQPQLLPL